MYSIDDLSREVGSLLQQQGKMLATAESCTGGGVAQAITSVPGSSAWYQGGVVSYANAIKASLLNVAPDVLDQCGAVSEEVAHQMAIGVATACSAEVSIATTGVAGPGGGTLEKPVGTVWIAWNVDSHVVTEKHVFSGDRHQIQAAAVKMALAGLIGQLKKYQ